MKNFRKIVIALTMTAVASFAQAQENTADEVINSYFENTGGMDAWKGLKNMKMNAVVNQQGMTIPIEIYNTKDGKLAVIGDLGGQKLTFMAYDGEVAWSTNQMTMAPEKMPQEQTDNMKLNANDFPSPFMDYKSKGYTVEYIGKETKEGAETHKIKLVMEPIMVNGKQEESISYYYFETENNVPIMTETAMAGQILADTMSDYDEVEGLFFPFSMTMMGGQVPMEIKSIEINQEIDNAIFSFPETTATDKK